MKHLLSAQGLIAAICLAIPATGFSSANDRDSHPAKADGTRAASRHECGDDHDHSHDRGRYDSHGHWHFYGPRIFVGGPFFWGPSFGFSYSPGPAYYGPYDGPGPGPGPDVYRGVPVGRGSVQDDLGMEVQRALADHGFYRGEIDGDIGPGSRAAIRAYQQEHGLEVTGRIDNALLRSLHID